MKKTISTLLAVLFFATMNAQVIELEQFATGFSAPVDIKNAGDDRLFVVEQDGLIKILNSDGTTNATPFLDISTLVSGGSEQGLLGVTFHPDYDTNGYFYVNYTDTGGDTQISRFSVSSGDPDVADPGSEFPIIDYTQPFSNHNGGSINFGPDGFLYIGSGDGGSGGDPGNRAQNTALLLGKLLRIDVDNPAGGNNYGIPLDNPFEGSSSDAQEIWAYGLRNPWKFTFDSLTGDIWIADVGQGAIEEMNKAGLAEAGLNYGWRCYEGTVPFNTTNCPDPSELTFPIAEYTHSSGASITGGYVYRGANYPGLEGYYFAADFVSGLIVSVDPSGDYNNLGTFGGNWATFGEDILGELYLANYNGQINRIIEPPFGAEDIDLLSIALFPNPAKDSFVVRVEEENLNSVALVDLKGSVLFDRVNINATQLEVDIQGLARGMYLVRIATSTGTMVKKLLIQ